MSYEEKRVYKAKVLVKFAEEGFRESVNNAAENFPKMAINDIPHMLECLLLEYEALKELREEQERAVKYYGEQSEE